jgi:Histidine kinase-, DNA gyrase B-, and HSP90-like ATPase
VTHTPPSGSPGGYPRQGGDRAETPWIDSTAADRRPDRRLEKFGRLAGMRNRPDAPPAPEQDPAQVAPATAAQSAPLADQPEVPPTAAVTAAEGAILSYPAREPLMSDPEVMAAGPAGAGLAPAGPDESAAGRSVAWPPTHAGGVPAPGYGTHQADARGFFAGATGPAPQAPGQPGGPAGGALRDYGTQGYGGERSGSQSPVPQTYGAPDYSSQAYTSQAYPSRAYSSPGYGTQGHDARAYGAQDYGDQARGAAERRAQDYSQPYSDQPYGDQPYSDQPYRDQAYGNQAYSDQAYGNQAYGGPPYRAREYGDRPYGQQAYPAQPPASGYASPGYASPGYAPSGYAGPGPAAGWAGQDYRASRPAAEPLRPGTAAAGPSWDPDTPVARLGPAARPGPGPATPVTPAKPAPAPASFPAASPAAPASAAEQSAEPLYGVLGGLALRDLTLVESLLELVEHLESREEDPQQLDSLFRVDHLATRMRRNSENLLVLAGQDRESQDFDPVPLLDVARAAVSEIADYDRAQVAALPGIQVLGVAADDVTHILAELLDNAMSKSPESAEVVIRAERTGDGTLVVSVEDSGIGIPIDRLGDINAALSRIPVVDVAVTRHMGLYVVGRLAHRHGIRVQLRERPYGGIVASVIIPPRLVCRDPDAPRDIVSSEPAGRYQPLSGAGLPGPQLSIEARGADGLRGPRQGVASPGTPYSAEGDAAVSEPAAGPDAGALDADLGARSGIGWPVTARQPVDAGQEAARERPAPAPAAGYPDALPVPRFEPADPSELPKRKPGALSAANGIPAPLVREEQEKVPVPVADEPAEESEAERLRTELSEFQLGQAEARRDAAGQADAVLSAGSGDDYGSSYASADTGPDIGDLAGGRPDEAAGSGEA